MQLIGESLYVANTDAIMKFPYHSGDTEITAPGVEFADLPGAVNHHWTKALLASPDGTKLYVGVGSNSNVTENGLEVEYRRAVVLEVDVATRGSRIYASGIRNPTGLQWEPQTGKLYGRLDSNRVLKKVALAISGRLATILDPTSATRSNQAATAR